MLVFAHLFWNFPVCNEVDSLIRNNYIIIVDCYSPCPFRCCQNYLHINGDEVGMGQISAWKYKKQKKVTTVGARIQNAFGIRMVQSHSDLNNNKG